MKLQFQLKVYVCNLNLTACSANPRLTAVGQLTWRLAIDDIDTPGPWHSSRHLPDTQVNE